MKSDERKSRLTWHKDILLATLDYILEQAVKDLSNSEYEYVVEHYQQQKQQIEKYCQQGRMDRLQQKLNSLAEHPRRRSDLAFRSYIKEKTGHDIDIFESVEARVDGIIRQNQIRNKKELQDISIMLFVYEQNPMKQGKVNVLKSLLIDFGNRTKSPKNPKL
ncbi:hypothetical protein [Terrimonas pollutisoli]|uniref:hypothetical protein n=1 Tax=Terrimonas pollutisoli TaxID=3034147 RepID=UPI0023EAF448|nr:hypothetical protein [Terrimonas sp. H1YJ31]